MVEVIETNIFVDNDNRIYDHQSRITEVEDWDTYCNAFELYEGRAICFSKIKELLYDDYHLSCAIYDDVCDVYARHFAYKMRTYSQQIKD